LELIDRKQYISDSIDTVYFGGGTPSLLDVKQIDDVLDVILKNYTVSEQAEITLEANPDDLTKEKISLLAQSHVNRLSIGVQSFDQNTLKRMNRRHSAKQIFSSITEAQTFGFENIGIDLIYGLPWLTLQNWKIALNKAKSLNIQHISAYHLTFEQGTVFGNQLNNGAIIALPEDESCMQYNALVEWSEKNNYTQYEISNFAVTGKFSKHNSNYWKQIPYIGVGVSAHSYNGFSRCQNTGLFTEYLKYRQLQGRIYTEEILTDNDIFNEYLLTGLRTVWGINMEIIIEKFGINKAEIIWKSVNKYKKSGHLTIDNQTVKLTTKGFFISDIIISEMFCM